MGLPGSKLHRGWRIAWLKTGKPTEASTVESVEAGCFRVAKPRAIRVGDKFAICPPSTNWNIHDNTVTGCTNPVVLEASGSATSFFRDNLLARGQADGVKQAIIVSGRVNLFGNHVFGFCDPDCAALLLRPDVWGEAPRNVYRDNVFKQCAGTVSQTRDGLWEACFRQGNRFGETAKTLKEGGQR